jgi:hypothetical protein
MPTKVYTIDDVRAAIETIDDMLRSIGFAANAGACKCSRCAKHSDQQAPAQAAGAFPAPGGPGGTLVAKPAPAPRAPRPGGVAVAMPTRVADEIAF